MIMEWIVPDGEGDFERGWGLRSMRGVRSVGEVGSTAWLAVVAVVRMEGAAVGTIRGESGELTSTGL